MAVETQLIPPIIPSLRNSQLPTRGAPPRPLINSLAATRFRLNPRFHASHGRTGLSERLDDILHHLLGVRKEHHGVVAIEEFVVDSSIADAAHRSFHEE